VQEVHRRANRKLVTGFELVFSSECSVCGNAELKLLPDIPEEDVALRRRFFRAQPALKPSFGVSLLARSLANRRDQARDSAKLFELPGAIFPFEHPAAFRSFEVELLAALASVALLLFSILPMKAPRLDDRCKSCDCRNCCEEGGQDA
jgi:hypothetical protein